MTKKRCKRQKNLLEGGLINMKKEPFFFSLAEEQKKWMELSPVCISSAFLPEILDESWRLPNHSY